MRASIVRFNLCWQYSVQVLRVATALITTLRNFLCQKGRLTCQRLFPNFMQASNRTAPKSPYCHLNLKRTIEDASCCSRMLWPAEVANPSNM